MSRLRHVRWRGTVGLHGEVQQVSHCRLAGGQLTFEFAAGASPSQARLVLLQLEFLLIRDVGREELKEGKSAAWLHLRGGRVGHEHLPKRQTAMGLLLPLLYQPLLLLLLNPLIVEPVTIA